MESFEALEIYQKIIYGNISNGEFFYRKAAVDAEIAKLMAIAYPDGPQADAAVPMSRYEPLLKSEREIRDKLARLEIERNAAIKAISEEATKRGRLEAEAEHYRKTLTGKVSRELYLESIEEQKKEILRLEAEVDRLKTAIKTFSDKLQYYDSETIAGLDDLRQAISGGR